jgi:non-ribosomal peptide synthetase component F
MQTIAHHILDLARHGGEAPAICLNQDTVSYRELGLRSTALAERLRPLAKPNAPIAIATSETVQMVTAALACWILGCPYLPIDPGVPIHRFEHVLRDSRAPVLLSDAGQLAAGPWAVVSFSEAPARATRDVIATPRAQSAHPAYIIYTSGSTGLAKGVAVSHSNLWHFAGWYREAFALSSSDRATQFASLSFDASVLEVWPTLSAGASLWPIARAAAMAETELRDFILQHSITHCTHGDRRRAAWPRMARRYTFAVSAYRSRYASPLPPRGAAVQIDQQLWSDRMHGARDLGPYFTLRRLVRAALDRSADPGRADLHSRRKSTACSCV